MKKQHSILYIVNDASIFESSLMAAIQYAKLSHAHIYFLRIFDSYKAMSTLFHIPTPMMRETVLDNLESNVGEFASLLSGLNYSCHVREGIWFIEAIQEAMRTKSDMMILTQPDNGHVTFASNSMHIIRKCPVPVWLIRNKMALQRKKILVAIDIDMNAKVKRNVNEKCLSLAKNLADSSAAPCEIQIAHCWSLPNEMYLREIASNISMHQIDEMTNRQKSYHEEWFGAFCTKHSDLNLSHAFFIKGEPEIEIPRLVTDEKIDILVMGTVNNLETAGLFISSRSETILDATHSCSVLTVKPDGFVSPVQ